ncbi:MAG: glucose-1-phosphate adenylyltransferase [Candidatus Omnitrophota bacterium]
MREVLCVVLGGGRGVRLYPLTKDRSKPAVPFAGKYRLIDIPISNSLNSGFNHIYVLTQFNSESLNKHVSRTYKMDPFSKGFVEIMAAEQSMESTDWFQGTADAVRRCLKHFNDPYVKYVLVLSGDQLYKMDLRELVSFHLEKKAEITIACKPVPASGIREFGIMCADRKNRIQNFVEKPKSEKGIKNMALTIDKKRSYLASMGIYLFNRDVLTEILTKSRKADFGKEVIPDSFPHKLTYVFIHQGYWQDIGTIKAFYKENLVCTDPVPPVDLFDDNWNFFTRPRYLPPAKIENCRLDRVVIGEGSQLAKCSVRHSVIGLRSVISGGADIKDTVIMGADYYEPSRGAVNDSLKGMPRMGIGRKCVIRKAIIDKNARIGDEVKIVNVSKRGKFDSDMYYIRDGIVIVPKNSVIPPGTVI